MDKREMAGDYEILQAVRLGGKEVLLGYNPKDGCAPYMTSYRVVNFFGDYIYPEAIAGNDYLEIMQAFLNRVQEQAKVVEQFREKYGVVENVSSRPYVSNSFHCGVWENISPIEK